MTTKDLGHWLGETANKMARKIYEHNVSKGWHDNGTPPLSEYLMNLHSEISELWEAYRNGKVRSQQRTTIPEPPTPEEFLCDKSDKMRGLGLSPLTCLEEELADILIRTLDTAHAHGVDIERAVAVKMVYNAHRSPRHGGKLC